MLNTSHGSDADSYQDCLEELSWSHLPLVQEIFVVISGEVGTQHFALPPRGSPSHLLQVVEPAGDTPCYREELKA